MITLTSEKARYFFNEEKGLLTSRGKFNRVFKGYDQLYRPVLIKQLLTELSADAEAIKRFSNEFTLRTEHPNLLSANDYFQQDGLHYIIRPWIDGNDLSTRINKLKPKEAVNICVDVLKALMQLHDHNILHLDVQPKNIILAENGRVYLTDLGLAAIKDKPRNRQPFNIYYSAPEQILNQQELVNETSDLFAAGMILLEALSHSKPQNHQNPEILMNLMLAAPLVNNARLKPALFAVIRKATSKPRFNLPPAHYNEEELRALLKTEQANRYQNAEAFINDLLALSDSDLKPVSFFKFW